MTLRRPEPLTPAHDLSQFFSGHPTLDDWLTRHALRNQVSGASRTYVVCEGPAVVAYYSLATGSIDRRVAPGRVRRNMPNEIPVMLLGRLAVAADRQGQGLGTALLRDASLRTLNAAKIAGIRAVVVHAIDDAAARFYRDRGFLPSSNDPRTLFLPMEVVRASIASRR